MKQVLVCGIALVMTAVLVLLYPWMEEETLQKKQPQVLVVWAAEGEGDVSAWLKKAAAAYEKATQVRVYLRTASRAETEAALAGKEENVLPDAVVAKGAGVPLLCRGYVLAVKDAEADHATPAPTPALFFRPTATPAPATPAPAPFPEELSRVALPAEMAGVLKGGYEANSPAAELQHGKAEGALLTPGQAQALPFGWQGHVRGDLFVPVEGRALTEEGQRFLSFLRGEKAQRLLCDRKLFSWDAGLSLYGPETPLLHQMENVRKNMAQ